MSSNSPKNQTRQILLLELMQMEKSSCSITGRVLKTTQLMISNLSQQTQHTNTTINDLARKKRGRLAYKIEAQTIYRLRLLLTNLTKILLKYEVQLLSSIKKILKVQIKK